MYYGTKRHEVVELSGDGDVVQLVEHRTGTPLTQYRLPGAARDFPPRVSCQCSLSHGIRTPPCAIACINICAHLKDLVVHVVVGWIIEALEHPACTVDWVARLCRSWLPPGKAIRISHGRNPSGTIQLCSSSNNNNTFGFELTRP